MPARPCRNECTSTVGVVLSLCYGLQGGFALLYTACRSPVKNEYWASGGLRVMNLVEPSSTPSFSLLTTAAIDRS